MHVDDFIDIPEHKDWGTHYAAHVLTMMRLPAVHQATFRKGIEGFPLFCTWKGLRYKVTGASRLGDIWLAKNPAQKTGYDQRVDVAECSEWSHK